MPNISTLMNFQPVVESAAASVISSSVGITSVYTIRGDGEDRPTPRVELQCLVGQPNGHVYLSSSREYWHDQYSVAIQALVTTHRAANEISHSTYVSDLRTSLTNNKLLNTASLMPNYVLLNPRLGGAAHNFDQDANLDKTALSVEYILCILPSAWQN